MDWNYWLGRKYAAIDQNAAADTARSQAAVTEANANANLTNVRAGLLPAESKATIGLTQAQTQAQQANALQTNTETKYIGPKTLADIMATKAQAGLYGNQGSYYGALSAGEGITNNALKNYDPRLVNSGDPNNPLVQRVRAAWGLGGSGAQLPPVGMGLIGGVSTPVGPSDYP